MDAIDPKSKCDKCGWQVGHCEGKHYQGTLMRAHNVNGVDYPAGRFVVVPRVSDLIGDLKDRVVPADELAAEAASA